MNTLYTLGYADQRPRDIFVLAEQLDARVVDIRFSPRSRIPGWSAGQLHKLFGERYLHLLALGNRNYKGGPVEFVDLESGVSQVGAILIQQPVILLCACAELNRCHRLPAADTIAGRYGVAIQHL